MKTKIIQIFGGPGLGKSTTAAGLFSLMKKEYYSVELVQEYAKGVTWSKAHEILADQFFISANQNHMIHRLIGKVEYIITDSPILLGLLYADKNKFSYPAFEKYLLDLDQEYDTINILLDRTKKYITQGRNQTESEAIEKDLEIKLLLDNNNIKYYNINSELEILNLIKTTNG